MAGIQYSPRKFERLLNNIVTSGAPQLFGALGNKLGEVFSSFSFTG